MIRASTWSMGFGVYVILMPFMSALAPSEWLPLPLLLLLVMSPLLAWRRSGPSLTEALRWDAGFWIAYLLGLLGMVVGPLQFGAKHMNHAAAWLIAFGLFFVAVRSWLSAPGVTLESVGAAAHRCLTVLSLAIVAEFILASFFGHFFADFIPYAHDDLNIANLVTDDFRRPRAFAHEPGFTALAFECLWPLTALATRSRRWRHALYACGFALLASAASMVALVVALGTVWLVRERSLRSLAVAAAVAVLLALLIAGTEAGAEIAWAVVGRKLDLGTAVDADVVAASSDAVSVLDRLGTYLIGLQLLEDHPFGIGWGSLGQAFADSVWLADVGVLRGSGMLSLYLDVAVAAGWAGLVAFGWFVARRVVRLLARPDPRAGIAAISLLAVAIHHALITEVQFPFLWFALALADRVLADPASASSQARLSANVPSNAAPNAQQARLAP